MKSFFFFLLVFIKKCGDRPPELYVLLITHVAKAVTGARWSIFESLLRQATNAIRKNYLILGTNKLYQWILK